MDSSKITVVGIAGRKQSGKDTVGQRYIDQYGFVRIAFADTLKEACQIIFGFSHDQLYNNDFKEVIDDYWGYSPRQVLQKVGTELFRDTIAQENVLPKIGSDIWVKSLHQKISKLAAQGHRNFVITDIRWENELNSLKDRGYSTYSIRIICPSIDKLRIDGLVHDSEAHIDDLKCDFDIINQGTISELYETVDRIHASFQNS